MKYVFNFLSTLLIGWPALVLAYCWAAARSGAETGAFLHEQHEHAAIRKFTGRKP
jgi:hypothetical protein